MKKISTVLFILLSIITNNVSAQFSGAFNHPGVLFTTEDLERMKNNINVLIQI